MQTFLPYKDYTESAKVLDSKRLGKQRVEALQILDAISKKRKNIKAAWQQHPAVIMWEKYPRSLCFYGLAMCKEWLRRGYKDTCTEKFKLYLNEFKGQQKPDWLGNEEFHISHQSNLLKKLPSHYKFYFPGVSPYKEYIWPK